MGRTATTFALGVLFIWVVGCAGPPALDDPDLGRTTSYVQGVPNFDMEAVVTVEEERSVIDVYYSLPLASLVFVQIGDRYRAEYEMQVRLLDRSMDEMVTQQMHREPISVARYDSTLSFHTHLGRLVLEAPPGDFVVEAEITDLESGESTVRRQAVEVVARGGSETSLSRILLESKTGTDAFDPVVTLHLPAGVDSLRASVALYNVSDSSQFELETTLVRFRTDTSVAAPPYWLIPSRGSLAYRGVDFGEPDTIQATRRILRDAGESVSVQFTLPILERGLYRMRVEGRDESGAGSIDNDRTFSVKHATFPRMTHLEDLIESLAYIAYDNEIDAIREGSAPGEMKRRFDAFWGSLVSNRSVAANLLELYYGRIEEANLLFTDYKEGWMTDRGMVFTILGPPVYIDRRIDMEIWYYSYGDRDPVNTYVFERVREERDAPFDTYILQRRPYYQHEWARTIERWRTGEVL